MNEVTIREGNDGIWVIDENDHTYDLRLNAATTEWRFPDANLSFQLCAREQWFTLYTELGANQSNEDCIVKVTQRGVDNTAVRNLSIKELVIPGDHSALAFIQKCIDGQWVNLGPVSE